MADINILGLISKLRPKVKVNRNITLDALADEIAEQSGFDRGDARDFAYKFANGFIRHLARGNSVKLGEIGSFRVSCDKTKLSNAPIEPQRKSTMRSWPNSRVSSSMVKMPGWMIWGMPEYGSPNIPMIRSLCVMAAV